MGVSLNEKTTIPLWGLVIAIPTLCAGILAFGFTSWQTMANAKTTERIETQFENRIAELERSSRSTDEKFLKMAGEIQVQLAEIKTTLKERGQRKGSQ